MTVVQEFMGHSNIGTTTEYYTTVSPDHAAKVRWVIDAMAI